MNRITALFLVISLFLSVGSITGKAAASNTGSLSWDAYPDTNLSWRYRPPVEYISEQNPPDFSWPSVKMAVSYDVKVCRDQELNQVIYEKKELSTNFYNFSFAFEPGTYYWSVRYRLESGEISKWREASRFILRPDASLFIVEEPDVMMSKIPEEHPRILVTKNTLEDFRKIKDGEGKAYYEDIYKTNKATMEKPLVEEPPLGLSDSAANQQLRGYSSGMMNLINRAGIIYLISQEKEVGEFGVKALMELASWDPYGSTAYRYQDQAFREILHGLSLGYDYFYELLTEQQRKTVVEAARIRSNILEHPTDGLQDAAYRLFQNPYQSHGWSALGYLLTTWIVFYGEFPEAENNLRKYLPLFANLSYPWSNEDGGWSQGTGYGVVSIGFTEEIRFTLHTLGILPIYNKAFYKNLYKNPLYLIGPKVGNEAGDQSTGMADSSWMMNLHTISRATQSGYAQWQSEALGITGTYTQLYYMYLLEKQAAKLPTDLPRATYFKDIGWTAMHSDLTDYDNRISMFFKSSPWGSFNHSHADQNSFILNAYGERLAIDSGYYDYYFSEFYENYYTKTYAHNAITFDGGRGQAYQSMQAKGKLTNFITHPDFDLTSGDASIAYNYATDKLGYVLPDETMSKVNRHIVYIRPDQFIIIDDLKSADGQERAFEWWLNAYDNMSVYESGTGARVTGKNAVLDMKVQYPKVTAKYSNIFSGPDMVERVPSGTYASNTVHKRMWFETPKVAATKMITTLDVHRSTEEARYVRKEEFDQYMKLGFSDGTVAYIKTGDNKTVLADGFEFDGLALIKKKETLMLIDGTNLLVEGEERFWADVPTSMILGKDEIGISSQNTAQVKIKTDEIKRVRDERGMELSKNDGSYGLSWDYQDGSFLATAYSGMFYSLYLNDKIMPGSPTQSTKLKFTVGNETKEIDLYGYYNHDGNKVLNGTIQIPSDFYTIEEIKEVNFKGNAKVGDLLQLKSVESVVGTGDNPVLTLKSASIGDVTVIPIQDHQTLKTKLASFSEAENFIEKTGAGSIYTTRSFLSGGAGVQLFNIVGDSMKWALEVSEDGVYDLAVKYVAWGNPVRRTFQINDTVGVLDLPPTGNYGQIESEWVSARAKISLQLKKGTNILTIYPNEGEWNFDWVGLIKSDLE